MGWPQCFFFCRIITHGDNMHIVSTYCMLYIPIETRRGAHYTHGGLSIETRRGTHYTHGGLSIETRRGTSLQKKKRGCVPRFFVMAGEERIELSPMVLETTVLPLNYSPEAKGWRSVNPLIYCNKY